MPIINEELWNDCVENNDDHYGGACVKVARRVMELLDEDETELHTGYHPDIHTPHGLICKADEDTNAGGITGFMAGAVASMVSQCHSRGEEFRKIHNAPYLKEGEEDKGGTVNPAVLIISTKEK